MGKTQDELNNLLNTGQTVFFVTLVLMQFGNLHSIRTRHLSWFQQNPFKKETRNLYVCTRPPFFFFFFVSVLGGSNFLFQLFGAMCISTILLIIAVYIPGFNSLFLTAPVPAEFWFLPFAYGLALFTIDEARKWFIRRYPNSFLAYIAW
jgi:sodium/potassium-transporting ATPase subunit alpha